MTDNWNVRIAHGDVAVEITRMGSMLTVQIKPEDGVPIDMILRRATAQMLMEALGAALAGDDGWPDGDG